MQGVFAESSLRKQPWRNPKGGRVGCLHEESDWYGIYLPTFAIIPCPLRPCIWRPHVPVPHVLASHTWCPQVPRLAFPSPKSPHTRPDVPVPLSPSHFYTQPSVTLVHRFNNAHFSPKRLFLTKFDLYTWSLWIILMYRDINLLFYG